MAGFGTLSPGEEAEEPPNALANALAAAARTMATLPRRAIENSQYALDTGNYDPRVPVEAATLPIGTGAIAGVPVKGAEMVLGAGAARLKKPPAEAMPPIPEMGERYPEVTPPELAYDKKTRKEFFQKTQGAESLTVSAMRKAAQREIDAGNYTPYFDPERRFDVDPAGYPPVESTHGQRRVYAGAAAAQEAIARSPASTERLDAAYQRGAQQAGDAGNWYHMGQLEDEFIKEYGPTEGRRLFKERFADAMAATTGGADPGANLMMAHYGNYLRAAGQPIPSASHQYPYPIGGRYASNNMAQYDKMINQGQGVTPETPKRYNFSANFTGNKAGATVDEQMSQLFQPGLLMPPGGTYGHYESAIADRARAAGVDPRYFQELAWAGAKDQKTKGGYQASPMIAHVNEAIERTHRITGMPKSEIVRRGLVRAEIPIYGLAGATVGFGSMAPRRE